jgi:glycosyltransferase involved in cell wall biosynthesis
MRIGMILDHEFPPDIRVENEIIALKNAGFDVYILSLNFGLMPTIDDFHGAKVIRIKANEYLIKKMRALTNTIFNFYPHYWSKKIVKFIKENKIDVLHVHDLYMFDAAFLANKSYNLPVVGDLHENYPAAIMSYNWATKFPNKLLIQPQKWKKLEGKYLKNINGLIVLSNYFKKQLMNKYEFLSDKKIAVYSNMPNLKQFQNYKINKNILNTDDKFTLFYFGAIAERRGVFTCFKALKELIKKIPEILLLLIGPVDKTDLKRFTEYKNDKAIKNHVIHYTWKDISTLPSYIKKSDVCLSPIIKNGQHESGVANKVFQYMLFERPLLVSNCIPQQKIVEEEICGLIHKSGDAKDLADKVIQLYKNEKLRKEMGENGKKAVIEKYNWENTSKNLIELYEKIEKIILK